MDVQLLAPGFQVEPYAGTGLKVRPANFEDAVTSTRVLGMVATFSVAPRWRTSAAAEDRIEVVVQGLADLVLRWQSPAAQIGIVRSGRRQSKPIRMDDLAPYELGQLLGGGPPFPNMVMSVGSGPLERLDDLVAQAFLLPAPELTSLVPALSQVSSAAVAQRPIDRVTPLWSALEVISGRGYMTVNSSLLSTSAAVRQEAPRTESWRVLSRMRARFERNPWFDSRHRKRLARTPTTNMERMHTATVVAFLTRSAVAHGHWPLGGAGHRSECRAAEDWMWNLVELGVENRLTGQRLPHISGGMRSRVTIGK